MKVLLFSHSSATENMGGAELTLLQMIDHWRQRRSDVEFVVVARTPQGRLQPELERRGVGCHTIDFDSWTLPVIREDPAHVILTDVMDSAAVKSIMKLIEAEAPDVVVTNTIVSPWAAFAAKFLGVPHVWMVHEYGDLDHGLEFRIGRAQTFEDIDLLSDLVVANSLAVRDHIAHWIRPSKLIVAYPVIDLHRSDLRTLDELDPAGEGGQELSLVMVGRLARSKGQWRLVHALARLRDEGVFVKATLVGSSNSDEGAEVLQMIHDLGLEDRIIAVGEQDAPHDYVRAADVGVTASDHEAFGRVTVEYMSIGKPVIASNTGANVELLRDGHSGWLFERDDIEDLVKVIRQVREDPTEVRRRGMIAFGEIESGLATRYPLDDALLQIESIAGAGGRPLERLPNFTHEQLNFPQVIDRYARDAAKVKSQVHASSTWRIGSAIDAAVRRAGTLARRLGFRR